ncbi:hypothetical protein [Roseivivax sp. CAU 1761]
MIELLFVACLSAEPNKCTENALIFEDVSVMTCMMGGQAMLAQWVAQNPKYEVSRWKCQPWNNRIGKL